MKKVWALTLLVLLGLSLYGQDDPDLRPVGIAGLPAGSRVLAYSVVETETGNLLVTEISSADGTVGFYLYDYVDHTLVARSIGPRMIPGDLEAPPTHHPQTRNLGGRSARVWPVRTAGLEDRRQQVISAPSLAQHEFARMGEGPWQLTPPQESPLTIYRYLLAADGRVQERCVLEPNITAVEDRMTTTGAWWVHPFGEPHLLVGILGAGSDGRRWGLRLHNENMEIVATAGSETDVDVNRMPDLIPVDLSGNGEQELLFFATSPESPQPFSVYRFARRDGDHRVLAFNLCSERMNGLDVTRVQTELLRRGYGLGPHGVDGWYGPDTRAAVIRFQRAEGLPVTGVVDDAVLEALGIAAAVRH